MIWVYCVSVDALRAEWMLKLIDLFLFPYFQLVRQDRVMIRESLSVKVYADIINGLPIK